MTLTSTRLLYDLQTVIDIHSGCTKLSQSAENQHYEKKFP